MPEFRNIPRPPAGTWTALARVDQDNDINETNENNNEATSTYTTTSTTSVSYNISGVVYLDTNNNNIIDTGSDARYTGTGTLTTSPGGRIDQLDSGNGAYSITNNPNGNYTVSLSGVPSNYQIIIGSRPATVSGGNATGVNFLVRLVAAPSSWSISGTVRVDNDGNGTGDVAYTGGGTVTTSPGSRTGAVSTSNGTFTIINNPNGTYTLSLSGLASGYSVVSAPPSFPVSGGNVGTRNFVVRRVVTPSTYSISGSVRVDNDGNGTGDAIYTGGGTVTTSPGSRTGPINTASGAFTITNNPNGTYTVALSNLASGYTLVSAPASFPVSGGSVSGRNFVVRRVIAPSTYSISGVVYLDSNNDGAIQTASDARYTGPGTLTTSPGARTDQPNSGNGAYSIPNNPNGNYTVSLSGVPSANYQVVIGSRPATVNGGNAPGVNFLVRLVAAPVRYSISGNVYVNTNGVAGLQTTGANPDTPYTGTIRVRATRTAPAPTGGTTDDTTLTSTGAYSITNLPNATYSVSVANLASGYTIQSVSGATHPRSVTLTGANIGSINFLLTPPLVPPPPPTYYSISGGVFLDDNENGIAESTDGDGKKDPGEYYVTGNINITGVGDFTSVAEVGPNGGFTTPSTLAAGSYTISYTDPDAEYRVTFPPPPLPTYSNIRLGPGCSNRANDIICDLGDNLTGVNFGIVLRPVEPWFKGIGGDMRSDDPLTNQIPNSAPVDYFSDKGSSSPTTGGVVFGRFNLTPRISYDKNWKVVKDFRAGGISTSYESMERLLKKNGEWDNATTINGADILSSINTSGVFKIDGDASIPAGTHNVIGGAQAVYMIEGKLTINASEFTVDAGSSIMFIVKEDIEIASNVGIIHGIYSANEKVIVKGKDDGTPDIRLSVEGSIIGNAGRNTSDPFPRLRNLIDDNDQFPIITILYRPDFVLNAPPYIRSSNYSIKEVAPGNTTISISDIDDDLPPTPDTATPTPTPTPTPTSPSASTPTPNPSGPVKAFPSAVGWGKNATGGRGGVVRKVTNLNNSGAGSLRAAWEAAGKATIIFEVAGTITVSSAIRATGDKTIAGETAFRNGGQGITIKRDGNYNNSAVSGNLNNTIIRFMRFRPGPANIPECCGDALTGLGTSQNTIIDHSSLSWSTDETMNLYGGHKYITFQNNILSEPSFHSSHEENGVIQNHGFAFLSGGSETNCSEAPGLITFFNTLFAHSDGRNPRIAGACKEFELVNTLLYNWGGAGTYALDGKEINIINHSSINGANTKTARYPIIRNGGTTKLYVKGIYNHKNNYGSSGDWAGVGCESCGDYMKLPAPDSWQTLTPYNYPLKDYPKLSASQIKTEVTTNAGAKLYRDAVDVRIINNVNNGGGSFINYPNEVGGWPNLSNMSSVPLDSDGDGMPNAYEDSKDLNKNNTSDGQANSGDGYTNLEKYLFSLTGDL